MGIFTEEITLRNTRDLGCAERGYIKDSEIRTLKTDALPDTAAWTLVINEEVRQKLGLSIKEVTRSTLANGETQTFNITEAVEIHWKNRSTELPAVVVPGAEYVLLGILPLEALDLMVDPVHGCLVGVNGDEPMHVLC